MLERAALFHHLPGGGGIRVASQMLEGMGRLYDWAIHCLEGSPDPSLGQPSRLVLHPFPHSGRLSAAERLLAPAALTLRLLSFQRACRSAGKEISATSERALVHNSMVVAAPPVLDCLSVPSLYFCYEYPRHIYEPELIRRTESRIARALLAPVRALEMRIDLRAVSAADSVVTFSTYMAGRIAEIYGTQASVVHPGVDSKAFAPGDGSGSGYVLSVGALWPYKGHDLAIKAVAGLESRRPRLLVVADRGLPGYGNRLRQMAERLDVDLEIRRALTGDQLLDAYRGAVAVLCCQAREPYGLVPLEAMACARPVVAVREGGFTDNVRDCETGLLVSRRSEELTGALRRILTDDRLARRLSASGRDFVVSERTIEVAAGQLAQLLAIAG